MKLDLKKICISLFVALMIMVIPISNASTVYAALPSGTTCQNIDSLIGNYLNDWESNQQQFGSSHPLTIASKNKYDEAVAWKKNNCTVCKPSGYDWDKTGYKDSRGWEIGRFHTPSGDIAFCVEPDAQFNACADYATSGNILPQDKRDKIARIVYGFNQTDRSDKYYVAAQLLIWDELGRHETANGSEMWGEKETILAKGRGESITVHKDVDLRDGNYIVNLGDKVTNPDKNSELHNGYFKITSTSGVSASKSGNEVNATLNDIYPLEKTVTVNGKGDERTGGNIDGGVSFTHPKWQNFFSFDGGVSNLQYTTFRGDSFTLTTATGDLEVNKLDEYGENAGRNHTYKIWYAKEDPNGQAELNGKKYSKYKVFQTEDDWKNGVAESVFTTNDNGVFNVSGTLPSGGKFNDGTAIGVYILEEQSTTNPYTLNTKQYAFRIEQNSTTRMTVTNEYRVVQYEIRKIDKEEPGSFEDEELPLNEALFEIYDVSHLNSKPMDTNSGNNPLVDNYFVKKGKTVDLKAWLKDNSVLQSVTGELSLEIIADHCDTAKLEGTVFTANKNDIVKIKVLNDGKEVGVIAINIINDDNSIGNGDYFILQGIPQFRGYTGHKYEQLVDPSKHYLPIRNGSLRVFYDEAMTQNYKDFIADSFGMVNFQKSQETLDGTDDGDGIYYYKDSLGNKKQITEEDIKTGYLDEKGKLRVPYLKHSRQYLVCEASKPLNYDIEDGSNSCYFINTADYAEGETIKDITRENRKARGNLIVNKENEWLDPDGTGIEFEIYAAKLQDTGLSYENNYMNLEKDEYGRPIKGKLMLAPDGAKTFKVDKDGKINVPSYLPFGYYILKEVTTNNSFYQDEGEYLFLIEHSGITNIDFPNENRDIDLTIKKKDTDKEDQFSEDDLYMNNAEFIVRDITATLDTNNELNPIVNTYFVVKGQTVDISTILADDKELDDLENITVELLDLHCDIAEFKDNSLIAKRNGVVNIKVSTSDFTKTFPIYIINDINVYPNAIKVSEGAYKVKGVDIFKGLTGYDYIQYVDGTVDIQEKLEETYNVREFAHYLPLRNTYLTFYYDKEMKNVYRNYLTDDFGLINFTGEYNEDGKGEDDGDNIFYYQDVKGRNQEVKEITLEEMEKMKDPHQDEKKGTLYIPHLKHSRTYLVCESKANPNYESYLDSDACFIHNTNDENYPEGTNSYEYTFHNQKGRGDLNLQKLNEWLEVDGEGVNFSIWKAKLQDTGLGYDENYMNLERDEYGRPIKADIVLTPDGEEVWTINEEGKIEIPEYLPFGFYILQEVDVTNPFDHNFEEILFEIKHSEVNEIEFVNENRTVSFDVFKQDVEETFRKLNGAEFTIYDISETLDTDMVNTDYGFVGDLESSEESIDSQMQVSPYLAREILFAKVGEEIDIYNWLIKDTYLEDEIANRPVKFKFSHGLSGFVDVDGIFHTTKTGIVDLEIYGGNYELYGTASDVEIYQYTQFDPYAGLEFYEDQAKSIPVNVESIEYTGDFDSSVIGTHVLHYTMMSKDHVLYEFDRTITVKAEDRHVCKYDMTLGDYYYADTKELCDEIDPGMVNIDHVDLEFVPLIEADNKVNEEWMNKFIDRFTINTVLNDEQISKEAPTFAITGLPVFRGLTGHSYIQVVNRDNHNLPLGNTQIVTYYDQDMKYPYKAFISDEYGMVDLNDENVEELAPMPIPTKDEDGTWYIPRAIEKEVYSCEFKEGFVLNDTDPSNPVCVNEANPAETINAQLIKTFELVKDKLEMIGDETLDSSMNVIPELDVVYYTDDYTTNPDGTKTDIVKMAKLHQEAGKIEAINLKHSRQYLVCESNLPEGYDYPTDTNACFLLDTGSYEEGIENTNATRDNYLRRLDVVLYKTNESKNIKLNGAVFDVWETFEEGLDFNVVDGSIASMNVKTTNQGTKYYDYPLDPTDEKGACPFYEHVGGVGDKVIGVDIAGNETSEELPNGTCYMLYQPNTVERKYLGRYVSGGLYLTYTYETEDDEAIDPMFSVDPNTGEIMIPTVTKVVANATVEVATDPNFTNIIKKVTTNDNGQVKVLGLADGIYYTRLQRPLKPEFTGVEIDEEGNKIIVLPTEDDYMSYDDLPEVYSQTRKHYVSKGMIHLPDIKYGHTLEFKEVEAPEGYYFDDSTTVIVPKAPYGVARMENYRINNAIIIPNTGISIKLPTVFDYLEVLPFKR